MKRLPENDGSLMVVESIREFSIYLIAVHFKVKTDYNIVRSTFLKGNWSHKISRWWLMVKEYDMEVKYRLGKKSNMWLP